MRLTCEPIKQSIMVQRLEINFSEETKEFLLKALQSEPVRHGKWLKVEPLEYLYKCSVCRHEPAYEGSILKMHYCPNCGAKMDKE